MNPGIGNLSKYLFCTKQDPKIERGSERKGKNSKKVVLGEGETVAIESEILLEDRRKKKEEPGRRESLTSAERTRRRHNR